MSEERITNLETRVAALEALLKPQSKIETPNTEFAKLKELVYSEEWPQAIKPAYITDITSDQDKEDRAEGILDMIIDAPLQNLSVLDFGCGEGHLSWKVLAQKPKMSVGYDIKNFNWQRWPTSENLFYSTNWEEVKNKAPYNIIIVYDVLDHISGEDNTDVLENLKKIKQVMAPNAFAYIRCHPFVSRHGTHLYHQLNKAYAHLVFTPEELQELGLKPTPHTKHVIHPVGTYRQWLQMTNFKVHREQITREPIEPFFTKGDLVTQRIKKHWKSSPKVELSSGRQFPTIQIEQQFIDFQVS